MEPPRMPPQPRWDREHVQRVLFNLVRCYEQAHTSQFTLKRNGRYKTARTPRRFILFGKRLPFLGGDSELLRYAIRIAKATLKDNDWWPTE